MYPYLLHSTSFVLVIMVFFHVLHQAAEFEAERKRKQAELEAKEEALKRLADDKTSEKYVRSDTALILIHGTDL